MTTPADHPAAIERRPAGVVAADLDAITDRIDDPYALGVIVGAIASLNELEAGA